MDFSEFSSVTTIGLESAACLLLVVIAYKIYRMKIHSKSGCCGDRFVIETMNKAGSSRDFEFSENKSLEKNKSSTII